MNAEQLERLARCSLFRGFGQSELAAVVGEAQVVDVAEGETVFREGDESRSAYVVLDGEVGIRTHILDEQQSRIPLRPIIVKLGVGEVFGELALLDTEPRSAEVFAVVASTLCVFDAEWLTTLAGRRSALAYRVLRNMAGTLVSRLRATNDKLRSALEYGWRARGLDRS